MSKNKIIFQMEYGIWGVPAVLSVSTFVFLLFPFIIFETTKTWYTIVWIIVFSLLAIFCIFISLVSFELISASGEGIRRRVFYKCILYRWNDIKRIEVKQQPVYISRGTVFSKKCILIYNKTKIDTDASMRIKYTRKNMTTLKTFVKVYNNKIEFDIE
ncbi:MAG: hypothetical protein LBQ40_01020 [Clostridiales bacterium]|nr:hypothetical protein [Clostridiales bacterium]